MSNPLISVIVPVYNVEKYIEKAINSVCNQTYKNIEILLIDDGSKDSSGRICDCFAERDSRIKVIHQKNGGSASARNHGLSLATGEYIMFMDGDDYMAADMIEKMFNCIKDEECDIAICGRYLVEENYKLICTMFTMNESVVYDKEVAVRQFLLSQSFDSAAWDKIYKKELFDDVRYPEGYHVSEDIPTTYRLITKADKIAHCGKPLYFYLQRSGAMSKSLYSERSDGMYIYSKKVSDDVKQQYPSLKDEADYFVFQNLLVLFYIYRKSGLKENKDMRNLIVENLGQILKNQFIKLSYKLFAISSLLRLEGILIYCADRLKVFEHARIGEKEK